MATTLITGGTVVSATGRSARRRPRRRRDDRRRAAARLGAARARCRGIRRHRHRRDRQVRDPRRHRRAHPHGAAVRRHRRDRHLRDRHPRGGVGRHDDRSSTSRCSATASASQDGLAAWHEKAAGNCAIDYGFHQIIGGVDDDSLKAMAGLIDEGITSFKLFMAYPGVFYSDDAQILKAMQVSRETGLLTMMHAENGPAIDVLAAQLDRGGQDRPVLPRHRPRLADGGGGDAPRDHDRQPHRRPAVRRARERQAGRRAARRGPRQAARTSSARPARSTSTSRSRSSSAHRARSGAGFEGAKWVCSTPLRSRAEGHQDHMWQALRTNDLQMVSTDHCPFCMKDQKELGLGDFRAIPNGIGSIEHRMDLMYQGVVTGKITLERWVELTSTTPARMFGLYGTQGRDPARAPTPTSSSTTRTATRRSASARPTT